MLQNVNFVCHAVQQLIVMSKSQHAWCMLYTYKSTVWEAMHSINQYPTDDGTDELSVKIIDNTCRNILSNTALQMYITLHTPSVQ